MNRPRKFSKKKPPTTATTSSGPYLSPIGEISQLRSKLLDERYGPVNNISNDAGPVKVLGLWFLYVRTYFLYSSDALVPFERDRILFLRLFISICIATSDYLNIVCEYIT